MQKIMSNMGEIFAPIIPALIVGGLILGFRNVIDSMAIMEGRNQNIMSGFTVLEWSRSFPLADR